jgi:putative peptide zinc metalloprotease protein
MTLTGASRITLHDLRIRTEAREWVVGRVDTGDFIAVPPVAGEVLRLLGTDLTIDQTRRQIQAEQGRDIDVSGFVTNLIPLGFVSTVDGVPVPGPSPRRPSLAWLRPAHVRWLLTWPVLVALGLVLLAAAVVAVLRPSLWPTYHDLLWTPRTSLVLAGNAVIGWSIIALHEFAHLATARAAGVPGRMSFGTRLQFLVAQTDVSGIWAAPRWQRMTVYLSGIGVNLTIVGVALLIRAAVPEGALAGRVAASAAMLSAVMVAPQLLLFMRTDLYFVLQDLTGCRNLYADGSAYLRHLVTRRDDPSQGLRPNERRAVRTYAWILSSGTAICITVALLVSVPFALTLLSKAVVGALHGAIDGFITIAIVGGYWTLWCRMWWHRHGHRVRARLRTLPRYHGGRREGAGGGESHGGDRHPQARQGRDDHPEHGERGLLTSSTDRPHERGGR